MKVLLHHIYEYKKGLRNLVLHTLSSKYQKEAENILKRQNIKHITQNVTANKINIFFGTEHCVEIIESFGDKPLYDYTPEEDFILGTMLGYDQIQQCKRYIKKTNEQILLKNK